MMSGLTKVALLLLSVAVFGEDLPKHGHMEEHEEEGESLPDMPGEWAQADQEEMPMKGQKRTAQKPKESGMIQSKKKEIMIEKTDDDDADDTHVKVKRGAPAPAPLDILHHPVAEASKEDDADHAPHKKKHGGLWDLKIFAETFKDQAHLSDKEFANMAEKETKGVMDFLNGVVENHLKDTKDHCDKDPMKKWYMELTQPYVFAEMYPEEAKKREEEKKKEVEFVKQPQESEDDVEAAHAELVKRESAPKEEKSKEKSNTVRSNVAVRVDANGNMVQEPPMELGDKSVRQADDTDSKKRKAVKSSPDADESPQTTAKPANVFDDGYESPEDKQREAEATQRRAYLSIGGFVVLILLVGWLFIRHRAQQMIERSTAFDDASSVSSSTVTEENPTVKVNRALLERMANISQKLSEKVEEARATSNADSNSSGGSRGYTRKGKKDPLLGVTQA